MMKKLHSGTYLLNNVEKVNTDFEKTKELLFKVVEEFKKLEPTTKMMVLTDLEWNVDDYVNDKDREIEGEFTFSIYSGYMLTLQNVRVIVTLNVSDLVEEVYDKEVELPYGETFYYFEDKYSRLIEKFLKLQETVIYSFNNSGVKLTTYEDVLNDNRYNDSVYLFMLSNKDRFTTRFPTFINNLNNTRNKLGMFIHLAVNRNIDIINKNPQGLRDKYIKWEKRMFSDEMSHLLKGMGYQILQDKTVLNVYTKEYKKENIKIFYFVTSAIFYNTKTNQINRISVEDGVQDFVGKLTKMLSLVEPDVALNTNKYLNDFTKVYDLRKKIV